MKPYKFKTALLVDDSYIDNLISRKILENNNFAESIVIYDSPQKGMEFLQNCIATGQNIPEIIFLDIRMPEMNGFEFLKEMNLIEGVYDLKIKVYVLSSSLDPTDLQKIANNPLVSKFLWKPLTNGTLQEIE